MLSSLILLCAVQSPGYSFRKEHDPDGIGKFYMGREIAQVTGHQAANWLDRPERESEEAPSKLIGLLKLRPGMTVVDVGAGAGTLSFPMAAKLLPGGKLIAEDIQPEMVSIVRERVKRAKVGNVLAQLDTSTDVKVPADSADLMILVDVYHELENPYEMMQSIVRGLSKGGRLVIVEYRREDPKVSIKPLHKMTVAQIRKEMAAFPLDYIGTSEILPVQHILTFAKR